MQTAAKKDSQFLKFLGEVRSHDVRPSSFRSKTGFFEVFVNSRTPALCTMKGKKPPK